MKYSDFVEFFNTFNDNSEKSKEYLDSIPSDIRPFLYENDYVDYLYSINTAAINLAFADNTNARDAFYWYVYDTSLTGTVEVDGKVYNITTDEEFLQYMKEQYQWD